jgi:hypothetical protein
MGGLGATWNRAVFCGAGGVPGCPPVLLTFAFPSCLFTRVVEL